MKVERPTSLRQGFGGQGAQPAIAEATAGSAFNQLLRILRLFAAI